MALLFWTASDEGLISKTFGGSLKSFGANKPAHHFLSIGEDGKLPDVGPQDVVLASGMRALLLLRDGKIVAKNRTLESLRDLAQRKSHQQPKFARQAHDQFGGCGATDHLKNGIVRWVRPRRAERLDHSRVFCECFVRAGRSAIPVSTGGARSPGTQP